MLIIYYYNFGVDQVSNSSHYRNIGLASVFFNIDNCILFCKNVKMIIIWCSRCLLSRHISLIFLWFIYIVTFLTLIFRSNGGETTSC